MNSRIIKIGVVVLISFSLFACSNNIVQDTKTENAVTTETKSKSEISPIANEDWFKNDIHMLYNPTNNSHSLVRGDGTIILSTLEPMIESIGKVEDIDGKVTNYVYKNFSGEKYIKTNISNTEEEYVDARPTQRCVVYDRNGKETGLVADMYSPSYSSINKIIYSAADSEYGNGGYHVFDVNTKEVSDLDCDELAVMNGKFLLSTSPWNENVVKEEIRVCDENLNVVKTIEGYSIDGVAKSDGIQYASLRKKIKGGEDSKYTFNFLDSNFDVVFDDDFDERIWTGDQKYLTLRRGDKLIDYSFVDNKIVGEEREYKKEEEVAEKQTEEKYTKMERKIEDDNTKDGEKMYSYVSAFSHGDKVLFIGHLQGNRGMFDHDPIDVYDAEGKKIAEFDDLSTQFSDQGYLFVNHDTVYNIDMQVVGKLKEKRNIESSTKFDKNYYYDRTGLDYSSVKPFTLYNDKFEPVLENLECIEMDVYDDYITVVDSEGTKLIDKDFNVFKKIDRKIDIRTWYDNKSGFNAFEDLENERMGVIDKDYNIVVDKMKYLGSLEEKFFTYQNGFEYGFMDYEGRPIIKYSIFNTMMEDSVGADYRGDYIIKYDDYD